MLSLSKRYAVYVPTSPRPSSKIFEFFGISPSASPTSSLRQLLTRQGTGGQGTPYDGGGLHADRQVIMDHIAGGQGWSRTEAYKVHKEPIGVRCRPCFANFVQHFGAIWFLIPINAGLIGLLLRQILIHVLIPSDLVHAVNNGPFSPPTPLGGHGIQIKTSSSILRTTQPFRGQVTLQTISTVFFFIDLVLFVLCSIFFILRLICFRQTAWREVLGLHRNRTAFPHAVGDGEQDLKEHPSHADEVIFQKNRTNPMGDLTLLPLAWLTLVTFAVCIAPEMDGAEPMSWNLIYGAYISRWIGAGWTVLTIVLIFGTVILYHPDTSASSVETFQYWKWRLSSNLLFTPIALSTLSVVGALLVSDILIPSPSDNPRLALPESAILAVLVLSFCNVGASLFLTAILFPAMLFTHLFSKSIPSSQFTSHHHHDEAPEQEHKQHQIDPRDFGLPRTGTPVIIAPPESQEQGRTRLAKRHKPSSKRKGMFITTVIFHLLTSLSLSSAAIQLLGSSLSPVPGGSQPDAATGAGAFLTNTNPSILSIPCLLLALLLLGICALWFLLGLVIFCYSAVKKQLRWDMALGHGIVLAFTSMGLASVVFAAELDSGFFRVVACVFLGLVVVGFVVNLAFTACWVVSGAYKRV
ncbi:hypothetical protein QBC37DRAFT_390105 [Rhypophila decipiens]|uniref:Uncharacterized protein n=1 Tax=Rhypophila decipiens TaxID=261697 RepID=A0AAN6Y7K3_9PEZI|nr:hypothetical protein QBC37DRAFT_390105 [Rhypophila decipiens]